MSEKNDFFAEIATDFYDIEQIMKESKTEEQDDLSALSRVESALKQHPWIRDAVVLCREDPAREKQMVAYLAAHQAFSPLMEGRWRHQLPHGAAVLHHHRYETDEIYRKIFDAQVYLQGGISLRNEDCVFDVGAHIGLFPLFVRSNYRGVKIFAFEPALPNFQLLAMNAEFYFPDAVLLQTGITSSNGVAVLRFYPDASQFSGFHSGVSLPAQYTNTMVEDTSVGHEEISVSVRTLSDVIREHGVERINLLKISAEESEWAILNGIQDDDWPRILQIVIELRKQEPMEKITAKLWDKGYRVTCDRIPDNGDYTYIYARRMDEPGKSVEERATKYQAGFLEQFPELLSSADLMAFLKEKAPRAPLPDAFVYMDQLPGRSNLTHFPVPTGNNAEFTRQYTPPRTPTEKQIAEIWSDLLGHKSVGIYDDFFMLGGHSLLAIQLLSRIYKVFGVEVPVRNIFAGRSFTIASLARDVEQLQIDAAPPEEVEKLLQELEGLSESEILQLLAEEEEGLPDGKKGENR